jgi:hypothetical protein
MRQIYKHFIFSRTFFPLFYRQNLKKTYFLSNYLRKLKKNKRRAVACGGVKNEE